jgi:hypothetical protein
MLMRLGLALDEASETLERAYEENLLVERFGGNAYQVAALLPKGLRDSLTYHRLEVIAWLISQTEILVWILDSRAFDKAASCWGGDEQKELT